MARPLCDSIYLHGLHDPGGEQHMVDLGAPGWVLVTEAIGSDPNATSGTDYRPLSNRGLGVIVRLNNGYGGGGTIPAERDHVNFSRRCANFVRSSPGAHIWMIGNEPNHPIEWPGAQWDWSASPPRPAREDLRGEPITPTRYARCYKLARTAIRALPGHTTDLILPAAVAPYNNLLTYTGNTNGDWVRYFQDLMLLLGPSECDGINIHAYTHGTSPALITSEAKMNAPFQNRRFNFRCYRDFLGAVPANMRHLPAFITETDQGDDPWRNENTGWVQAAYAEIDAWNRAGNQVVRALILYRWPQVPGDRWGIAGKAGVIEDFRRAVASRRRWDDVPIALTPTQRAEKLEADLAALKPSLSRLDTYTGTLERLQDKATDLKSRSAAISVSALQQEQAALAAEIARLEQRVEVEPEPPPVKPPQPKMTDLRGKLPASASKRYPRRALTAIRRVVIHHTAGSPTLSPQSLARYQVNQGKPGITYHFYILADGRTYWTQPFEVLLSTTARSDVNADSLAVCLAGDFTRVPPGSAQLNATAALVAWLMGKFSLPVTAMIGRKEIDSNASPGNQWLSGAVYKKQLVAKIQALFKGSRALEEPEPGALEMIAALEAQVAELNAIVDQVPELEALLAAQRAEAAAQQADIGLLRDQLAEAAGGARIRQPAIADLQDVLPRHPTLPPYPPRRQPISALVVHHTDSPSDLTPQAIARYHVWGERKDSSGKAVKVPWPGIGFHYLIGPDGLIYRTQAAANRSFHVSGPPNDYSVGIALIGRFTTGEHFAGTRPTAEAAPTPAQVRSTAKLIAWLMQEYGVPLTRVLGHGEISPIAGGCPGDGWRSAKGWGSELVKAIRSEAGDAALTGLLDSSDGTKSRAELVDAQIPDSPTLGNPWTVPDDWVDPAPDPDAPVRIHFSAAGRSEVAK